MGKEQRHSHHLCFPRAIWNSQEPTTKLRENRWLKIPLDTVVHGELHKNVSMVPVPGHAMADRIRRNFEPVVRDYIASHENLIRTIEEASGYYKTSSIERELGGLIVVALLEQKPFLVEGLIVPEAV